VPKFHPSFMLSAYGSTTPPSWNARLVVYTSRRSGHHLAWAAGAIATTDDSWFEVKNTAGPAH